MSTTLVLVNKVVKFTLFVENAAHSFLLSVDTVSIFAKKVGKIIFLSLFFTNRNVQMTMFVYLATKEQK